MQQHIWRSRIDRNDRNKTFVYLPTVGFCISHCVICSSNKSEKNQATIMVENNSIELTEQEAELYDRQIRLWGLDSQKR